MPKTYDPACLALAEHFLRDEPCAFNRITFAKNCDSLAKEIQQTIEDWHYDHDAERAAMSEEYVTERDIINEMAEKNMRLTRENEALRKAILEISGPPFVGLVRMRQIVETTLASLKEPT